MNFFSKNPEEIPEGTHAKLAFQVVLEIFPWGTDFEQ